MTHREIILSDMSACQPAEALAWENCASRWRLVDYQTEGGMKGVMAFASPELGAREITLPLNASGPHAVYLGINYSKPFYGDSMDHLDWSAYGDLEVKLTGDFGYTRVAAEQLFGFEKGTGRMGKGKYIPRTIQQTYWRTADLTGQALHLRPPIPPYRGPEIGGLSNLSYVRLVPLDEAGVARWQRQRPRPDTRNLAYIYCPGHISGHIQGRNFFHPTDRDWFRHELQPALDGDFAIFSCEAIRGGLTIHPSRIADVGTPDGRWPAEWVDPVATLCEMAHDHGLKFFVALRQIGISYPMTLAPIGRARHVWERLDFTKRDRDGSRTTELSLAYPEVRQYWLSLLREALDNYALDGLTLYFHRFKPFALYEPPVVADFQAKYGQDPRELPETDPRYVQHCADYVTTFVREVRALLAEKPGRELAVTFYGYPSKYDNFERFDPVYYNCDVDTWLREGLVDYLWTVQGFIPELISHWRSLSPTVRIWPDLMPRAQPGEDFARLAKQAYAAGADGFILNDSERRAPHISEWAVERLLGHRELLDDFIAEAPGYYQRVLIQTLNGFATRYSFNNFGA
jgi:hypothetical protein